jgi:GntR family transcriptional regulator/MocR family aminotransferase
VRDSLFHLERVANVSIQTQIREMLVSAILDGQLLADTPLPSSRNMSKALSVSRNTVVLAYQALVDDGYLTSRERSGFYVNPGILEGRTNQKDLGHKLKTEGISWGHRFKLKPSENRNHRKPLDWQSYNYPFISNQVDPNLFPITAWRECSRQAMGKRGMDAWTSDTSGNDDLQLIEQIRSRLLPRRGILAGEDEVLITLGAQNALYMLASLLISTDTNVTIEDPGYPDARNIFGLKTKNILSIPVDEGGLPVDSRLDPCQYVYVTPSHQSPTTRTMPIERRKALLDRASQKDFVIIEDDYESETNYSGAPTPALKSLDVENRVIYIGSMSKTLFPGLRLGYVVASAELIKELRALRLCVLRHTPNNNQRTLAFFLSLGHHDALIHRLHRAYRSRWEAMAGALNSYLPNAAKVPTYGGSTFWVEGPMGLDADALTKTALENGVVIEPGSTHFADENGPKNFFKLGFSSIPLEKIQPGIKLLAKLISQQSNLKS